MIVQIDQQDVFIATGGSKFEESKPTIIYLHGSGLNSTAWVALSSQFPRYGFNVIKVGPVEEPSLYERAKKFYTSLASK